MTTIAIVADINEILHKHGVSVTLQQQDIYVSEKIVGDMGKASQPLSNAITDHLWPSIAAATVYHYTSRDAAESILATDIIRLTNIEKRVNDGEIVTFCKAHNLLGYLENDANGAPTYRSLLMPQLFYASFTESNLQADDEEYFWNTFASSDGVRLTFDVTAKNPNFRRIAYEPTPGSPIPLLAELAQTMRSKYQREFVLQGISRLCAFYLCGKTYGREREYRALYKAWPELGVAPVGTGPASYVEIPLNVMGAAGYKFSITEVHAHTRPTMPGRYVFSQRS